MWYHIIPEPFTALGERERAKLLARWMSLLNASPWLRVSFFLLEEEAWGFSFYRFGLFAKSPVDPSSFGFHAEAEPPPRPLPLEKVVARGEVPAYSEEEEGRTRTRRVSMPAVRLEDGSLARAYVVTKLPAALPEAVVSEFYGLASEVHMFFNRIEPGEAGRKLPGLIRRLEALLAYDPSNTELQRRIARLRALEELQAETAALFRLSAILIVRAGNEQELVERCYDLESLAASRRIELYAPRSLQVPLYELRRSFTLLSRHWLVPRFVTDTFSLQAFYPFVSEELVHPDGVLLGRNVDTGAPVIVNPFAYDNYNWVIIGQSGKGKSMLTKVYLSRLRERYPYPPYIVDPEGEYARVVDRLAPGAAVVRLHGKSAGLDPVRLAQSELITTKQAVAILRDVYGIPRELEGELTRLVRSSTSIFEVYDKASQKLKNYMENVVGADAWIYEGELPRGLRHGAVFDLSGIQDKDTKALVASLVSSLLSALLGRRSILVVDEGWLFMQYESLASLMADIARRGRKRGIHFVFISQKPGDVLENPHGRTVVTQAQVQILLGLDAAALDELVKVVPLSENEQSFLLDAPRGYALLRAGGYRLRVEVMISMDELEAFSTTPFSEKPAHTAPEPAGLEEVEV